MLQIVFGHLTFLDFVQKVMEAFQSLPGIRGFAFPKYELVASHGDPISALNISFRKAAPSAQE